MKIAITGGTGLVGKALSNELIRNGHQVIILTRKVNNTPSASNPEYVQWLNDGDKPETKLEGVEAFVNLAGATINDRWSDEYKQKILESRLQATSEVVRIIGKLEVKPKVLINASAVGYYGTSRDAEFTEQSPPASKDFLSETVAQWEAAAARASDSGARVVFCRFGVILDNNEGALQKMVLPYKLFAGGKIGSGHQWLSWIHIDDVVSGIIFALQTSELSGPVNFTAPDIVTMDQFGKVLSTVVNRPHWLPVPSFVLKTMLGEMSILVLEGQKVIPQKLLQAGYEFRFPKLESALSNILGK